MGQVLADEPLGELEEEAYLVWRPPGCIGADDDGQKQALFIFDALQR